MTYKERMDKIFDNASKVSAEKKPEPKKWLPLSELVHGAYYKGDGRGFDEARWDSVNQRFYYWRHKWDDIYTEIVYHPDHSDCMFFMPYERIAAPEKKWEIPLEGHIYHKES